MKLQLHQSYLNSLDKMLAGQPEDLLNRIRELRSQEVIGFEEVMEQKLLSFRFALKNNETLPDLEELDAHKVVSPDLRAETFFVRGMYFMHLADFKNAEQSFLNADLCYAFYDNHEKSLLSQFNLLMARCSLDDTVDFTQDFMGLLEKAMSFQNKRIEAVCLRQLSYIHFDHKRFVKAEQLALRAVQLFENLSALSDMHLCLIQWADALFETGQIRAAQQTLKRIEGPVDKRVDFPLAYLQAKIQSENLNLATFDVINPYWLKRHRSFSLHAFQNINKVAEKIWIFKKTTGLLYNPEGHLMGKIKFQSLEGQLLRALSSGPLNRHALSEILWPEYAQDSSLDDRFYRLVSRLKYKIGEYITFDGKRYSLNCPLKIK